MKPFSLVIGASALFIAGCAAYFSVRGIALTFGAVSSFTIPIIIMASSLEFGKLVAASFLYRHWKTCNRNLRNYLLAAVLLLIGITSAGIYGYLSQAFEETLSQVEGYEKEITSLQRQQGEFDRLIKSYQSSGLRGSELREEKQGEERIRLEKYIAERRADVESAEQSKGRLAQETDQVILGERQKREDEKKRLEQVISVRRADVQKLEDDRLDFKKEIDLRIAKEAEKEEKINQRIAELDAAVKVYRDQGPGGFLKEDGFKKAAELLKSQSGEREALRTSLSEINISILKAREDLNARYEALDIRVGSIQSEIADANKKITSLTTGGAEQADNVKTALENLQEARASVDERIKSLEAEIAEANKKISSMSEVSSDFGPDSSAELEEKKSELLTKKEDAERKILELEGKIRATDIGSFKFVARAFDSEVAAAEATENPILIEEALDRAVNRVVKWFIFILVLVFDPLAVTLVVAFNATLLRVNSNLEEGNQDPGKTDKDDKKQTSPLVILLIIGVALFGIYKFLPDGTESETDPSSRVQKASLVGEVFLSGKDDRALPYVPEQSFGVFNFGSLRMVEEVGMTKIISNQLLSKLPFLKNMLWDSQAYGVQPNGRVLYFMQLPSDSFRSRRPGDVLFGLILPIGNEDKVKNFIVSQLGLKAQNSNWEVRENLNPNFHSIHHRSAHISVGLDENCLVLLTSWWSDQPDPSFLDSEMQMIFQFGQGSNTLHPKLVSKLNADDYDLALFLFGENFFIPFEKTGQEAQILSQFEDYLAFDLSVTAKTDIEGVSLEGQFDYHKDVLDAGFGLKVAALMDQVRSGPNAVGLQGVYGEFVEIFLQRLDFYSIVEILEKVDLSDSELYRAFESLSVSSRVHASRNGKLSVDIDSTESGGKSLQLAIDLVVEALNPLGSAQQAD